MKDGFIKVASAAPEIRVADTAYNAEQIITLMAQAAGLGVHVLVLPELCLTGSTCGDLFRQDVLLDGAEKALAHILAQTAGLETLCAVGLPVRAAGRLYNCAALLQKGELLAVIPKAAGDRWFSPAAEELLSFALLQEDGLRCHLPLAPALVQCSQVPGLAIGVEIGSDLMQVDPVSRRLAQAGATLILNPAAAPALAGGAKRQREQLTAHSSRLCCGYVRANAGEGESTTDLVFDSHHLIAENGRILAESRFEQGLLISEIDVQRLTGERRRTGLFHQKSTGLLLKDAAEFTVSVTKLTRSFSGSPFVPESEQAQTDRWEELLTIQSLGLKKRVTHTNAGRLVVGVSGGLDSTLAMLVCARTLDLLGMPRKKLLAVTMPCFGTTARTKSNAELLAEHLGAELRVVDIGESVKRHFADIGHDFENHNVVFENAQARERTQVIMDIANACGGLVIGTGDLSELALGWATYNGDHMSMYGVNGSIPKTLVRHLVAHCADTAATPELAAVLRDILATPVSPELLPAENGEISQKTEDLVGPYELHDFFLYYLLRWGFSPAKVRRLANYSFAGVYDDETIRKWLYTFCRRFFQQQFKRSCLPDGPKTGTLSLSPRGDWQMPSDAVSALWLAELE